MANPDSGPPVGSIIAEKYEVLQAIGSSENGSSYKVQERGGLILVLKILCPKLQNNSQRMTAMKFGAKVAYGLSSPNLSSTMEFGEDPKYGFYLVREYVEGKSLSVLLREKGVLNQIEFMDIFQQACKGMAYLHRKGYLHGQLKPNNIILTADYVVKVVDIGVRRQLVTPPDGSEQIGNPSYLSPEQCLGENFDQRADIYSMACVMYEAISQNQVFGTGSESEVKMRQIKDKPIAFSALVPPRKVDSQIETVIFRCLEKKPDERYPTLDTLQTDLRRIEEGDEIKAIPKSGGLPSAVFFGGIAFFLLVAFAGVSFFLYSLRQSHPNSNPNSSTSNGTGLAAEQSEAEAVGGQLSPELAKEENEGNKLVKQGKFEEAVEIYNRIEPTVSQKYGAESVQHLKIMHRLAKTQYLNSDTGGARDTYLLMTELLKRNPQLAPPQYKPQLEVYSLAREHFAKNRIKVADSGFALAYKIDKTLATKNSQRYHFMIWQGKCETLEGDLEGAENSFKKTLDVLRHQIDDPDNLSFALTEYARLLIEQAKTPQEERKEKRLYQKASDSLKEAIAICNARHLDARIAEAEGLLKMADDGLKKH